MSTESQDDWRGLGAVGHVVARTLDRLEAEVRAGVTTSELDRIAAGLVLTIEPMVSAGAGTLVQDEDGWTIRTADGRLATHDEHPPVVTGNGPVILTAA